MSALAVPFVSPRRIQAIVRTASARRSMKARIVSLLRRIGVRSLVPARAEEAPGLSASNSSPRTRQFVDKVQRNRQSRGGGDGARGPAGTTEGSVLRGGGRALRA